VRIKEIAASAGEAKSGDNVIKAPMYGRVLELLAGVGDRVAAGQRLAVIEAMKMEHTLRAPFAAVVKELPVSSGAHVVVGAPIMVLEPIETVATSSA
jgi:biotin carboxyl carrier protein